MARRWRLIREQERSLGRPLACAWHVDGIAVARLPPELRQHVSTATYPDGSPTFAFKENKRCQLPGSAESLVARDAELPAPQSRLSVTETQLQAELGCGVRDAGWFEALTRKIFENGGCMVTGPGGVGKTHLLKTFKALAQREGCSCFVVA